MKRFCEIAVLIIYTCLNIKLMYPLLVEPSFIYATAAGGSFNYLGIFLGLFLNAGLILYYLRNQDQPK